MFIYKVTNTITGDCYIGKTKNSVKRRFVSHIRNAKNGMETHLCRAIRKYNKENFIVETLEEVFDDLNERERHWIAELNPAYNMTSGGDGGDTSLSPAYKEGMKRYYTRRRITGWEPPTFEGRTHSDESRIKQTEARKKFWSKRENIERQSKRWSGEGNPMFGKTPKNSCRIICDGIEYNSLTEATKMTGVSVRLLKKYGKLI